MRGNDAPEVPEVIAALDMRATRAVESNDSTSYRIFLLRRIPYLGSA